MLTLPLIIGAFVAGLVMFLAPCTLPIVPGYLAFIAGGQSATRGALIRNALAFVVGFGVVFVVLGTFAVAVGHVLGPWRAYVPMAAGGIIVLFGLVMLGLHVPGLSRERHIRMPKALSPGHPSSSLLIGALFALGWSPCIGPLLGTILLLASATATAPQGAFLLLIFSVGLGVPFVLCALLIDWAGGAIPRMGALSRALNVVAAFVLVGVGGLMLVGQAGLLVEWGQSLLGSWYDALLRFM